MSARKQRKQQPKHKARSRRRTAERYRTLTIRMPQWLFDGLQGEHPITGRSIARASFAKRSSNMKRYSRQRTWQAWRRA